jgi:hypothetical protein
LTAALSADQRPHFLDRLPEAECTVGDRQLRSDGKTASLQVEEKLSPGLGALAHAVDQADELRFALRRGANDDQQAVCRVLEPMDSVGQKYT